ncbi:putative vesicle-associated membrane-protein-associated protein [Helianthus anomalus]
MTLRLLFYCYFFFGFIEVKMKAQKEAPPDMQCRDKFLLQSKIAKAGATPKDITPEMDLLRPRSHKSQGGVAPLMSIIIVGLIGWILGYIMKK